MILPTKIPSATISGDWSQGILPHQDNEENEATLKYTSE